LPLHFGNVGYCDAADGLAEQDTAAYDGRSEADLKGVGGIDRAEDGGPENREGV